MGQNRLTCLTHLLNKLHWVWVKKHLSQPEMIWSIGANSWHNPSTRHDISRFGLGLNGSSCKQVDPDGLCSGWEKFKNALVLTRQDMTHRYTKLLMSWLAFQIVVCVLIFYGVCLFHNILKKDPEEECRCFRLSCEQAPPVSVKSKYSKYKLIIVLSWEGLLKFICEYLVLFST